MGNSTPGSALIRSSAKTALAACLNASRARQALASWNRWRAGGRRILVLGYHRVVPDFAEAERSAIPGLLISTATLKAQLECAASAGFEPASLEDALEVMAGRRKARSDLLVVTFDDGYRDVAVHAAPLLASLGVPAICYLATGFIGTDRRFDHDRLYHLARLALARRLRPQGDSAALLAPVLAGQRSVSEALDDFLSCHPVSTVKGVLELLETALASAGDVTPKDGEPMSWDEVRRLAGLGFSLGAHTRSHAVLTLTSGATRADEIRGSKEDIERETGQRVRDFSYCNGWYSAGLIRELAAQGFRSAVTTEDLPNRLGGDPFLLRRKVIWENASLGPDGAFSAQLTRCQLDDVFGSLGLRKPVPGRQLDAGAG